MKVENIRFDIRPPRLAVLKLSILNKNTLRPSGETFTIKYHDMNDVVDFLVLHETFKSCSNLVRGWRHGDRIRQVPTIHDTPFRGSVSFKDTTKCYFIFSKICLSSATLFTIFNIFTPFLAIFSSFTFLATFSPARPK